jgi:hypothetical protein
MTDLTLSPLSGPECRQNMDVAEPIEAGTFWRLINFITSLNVHKWSMFQKKGIYDSTKSIFIVLFAFWWGASVFSRRPYSCLHFCLFLYLIICNELCTVFHNAVTSAVSSFSIAVAISVSSMLTDYNLRKRIYVTLLKYHSPSRHKYLIWGGGESQHVLGVQVVTTQE